jgi:outer membrane protein assembly factor BamB
MKKLSIVLNVLFLTSCSFDNKTGIWEDISNIPVENVATKSISDDQQDKKFEDTFSKNKIFNEEKKAPDNFNIKIDPPLKIANWQEQYAIPTNNVSNFYYSGNKILLSKSRKLSKQPFKGSYSKRKIVFYKNKLISYDHKGKIFIYSLNLNKKVFEYNFYKKKFKNFDKEINFIVNENFLYAADNLGYIYALDLEKNSIIWAKNFGIPFRSNLKFVNGEIFLANQDNTIYAINSKTGDKKWQFATTLTYLKSDFENNFALDLINNNLFFLNTSGELYSINYLTQKINWVLNFKNSDLAGDVGLFFSQPIVVNDNNLIITTSESVLSYNTLNGSKNWNFSAKVVFKPIISLNYTYLVLENDLLVCLDNVNGEPIWSKNIFSKVEYKKIKRKFEYVADFKIVDSLINIYSTKGHLLSFNPNNGNLVELNRISKRGINSEVVFLNNNMLFINNQNKLLKFN